jgi:hypothetical protein
MMIWIGHEAGVVETRKIFIGKPKKRDHLRNSGFGLDWTID